MKYFSPAILDGSVTTASLADNSVTQAKMADSAIGQSEVDTTTVSLAGTIVGGASIYILLLPYAFFPLIHVDNSADIRLSGHVVDTGGADGPRFSFYNTTGTTRTYDVDCRYII